jgi:hypothetical protein
MTLCAARVSKYDECVQKCIYVLKHDLGLLNHRRYNNVNKMKIIYETIKYYNTLTISNEITKKINECTADMNECELYVLEIKKKETLCNSRLLYLSIEASIRDKSNYKLD